MRIKVCCVTSVNQIYVVLLLGYPAVGKRTVGIEVAKQLDAVLVDNASIFYPIVRLLQWDGKALLPPGTLQRADPIREAIFSTIEEIAPASISYVFTDCLEDTSDSSMLYTRIRSLAMRRGSHFLAVVLTCDIDEQTLRIGNADRVERLKGSDPEGYRHYTLITALFMPPTSESLTYDTTNAAPVETANVIVQQLRSP